MPRDGANIYTLPFPDVVPDTEIESTVYNGFTNDVAIDLNTPRPILAGGTGASNADQALVNLGGEKAAMVVTNYDSQVWQAGSFYSAAGATGSPVDGHAFSGIAYVADPPATPPANQNVVVEARDATDNKLYVRRKTAGVWGAWMTSAAADGAVAKVGDTMSGALVVGTVPALSAVLPNSVVARSLSTQDNVGANLYVNSSTPLAWKRMTAGFGGIHGFDPASGIFSWYGMATGAADADSPIETRMTLDPSNKLTVKGYLGVSGAIHNWPLCVKTGANQNIGFLDGGGSTVNIANINDTGANWQPIKSTSPWTFEAAMTIATGAGGFPAGSAGTIMVQTNSPNQATMTFHVSGAFATNFGLSTDGNFYMGGWSHGGSVFRFYTTRDGTMITANRLVYAGDYQLQYSPPNSVGEPWLGAVATGGGMNFNGTYVTDVRIRLRWMQVYAIGVGWMTIGTA